MLVEIAVDATDLELVARFWEAAEAGTGWVVLRDPEGTHFCVCPLRR